MSLILVFTANFFMLIICLMGMQSCYFKRNWKWYWLMLACVLLSAGCLGSLAVHYFFQPSQTPPPYMRQLTTPL